MKKFISLCLCSFFIFLYGCNNITSEKTNEILPPTNSKFEIEGEWEVIDYKILEESTSKEYIDTNSKGELIKLSSNYFDFEDKSYVGVNHKLKLVKNDYVISYETNLKLSDLNLGHDEVEIYSGYYKQGILYEFIRGNDDRSYIYFSGVLYQVKKIGEVKETVYSEIKSEDTEQKSYTAMPEGVLVGLKTPAKTNPYGEIIPESYRTVWISVNNGEIVDIEQRNNIIFPRMDGIWSLEKKVFENDKNYIEYFNAKSLDGKSKPQDIANYYDLNNEVMLYRTINFVGNDYISTEAYEGEKFTLDYNKYQVLPIDNLLTNKPMVIQDIFTKDANSTYKADYEQHMNTLTEEEKKGLSKYINYENFTLRRGGGKWNVVGRVSPIDNNKNYTDYPVNLKPTKKILNYDTLIIPWKVIKGKVPFVKDVFTSPGGNIALIVFEDKIDIYNIQGADLSGTPIASVELNEGEQIIMAEWCTGEFVNKWYNIFKEESKSIK
ncbi:MAG: hypothetical protein ACRC2K_06710 [Clostridium sp.]